MNSYALKLEKEIKWELKTEWPYEMKATVPILAEGGECVVSAHLTAKADGEWEVDILAGKSIGGGSDILPWDVMRELTGTEIIGKCAAEAEAYLYALLTGKVEEA